MEVYRHYLGVLFAASNFNGIFLMLFWLFSFNTYSFSWVVNKSSTTQSENKPSFCSGSSDELHAIWNFFWTPSTFSWNFLEPPFQTFFFGVFSPLKYERPFWEFSWALNWCVFCIESVPQIIISNPNSCASTCYQLKKYRIYAQYLNILEKDHMLTFDLLSIA